MKSADFGIKMQCHGEPKSMSESMIHPLTDVYIEQNGCTKRKKIFNKR